MVKSIENEQQEVVFRDQKGNLTRVSVDSKTDIKKVIEEREALGEIVEVITEHSRADQLIQQQQLSKNSDSEQWRR